MNRPLATCAACPGWSLRSRERRDHPEPTVLLLVTRARLLTDLRHARFPFGPYASSSHACPRSCEKSHSLSSVSRCLRGKKASLGTETRYDQLLVVKSNHRIHVRCAPRGQIAGQRGDRGQDSNRERRCRRIVRGKSVEHARNPSADEARDKKSRDNSHQNERERLAQNHAGDIPPFGAERHPNSDFIGSTSDTE